MIKRISLEEGDLILEPSAGDGVFIDEMLKNKSDIQIDAYDLNVDAIDVLKIKYTKNSNVNITHGDTLLDLQLDIHVMSNGKYDKIIGNPPYGAWQDQDKRSTLKKKYAGFYVKETYTLFLLRCISLLKINGILSFIIPDTFMNLHRHNNLREYMLLNTKIKEIVLFPSKFFPGIQYGYSKMCIVTLQKTDDKNIALDNDVKIIKNLKKPSDIDNITHERDLTHFSVELLNQRVIFDSIDKAFLIKAGEGVRNLINSSKFTLVDIADCVTGIYTGDNKKYFKVSSINVKNNLSKCPVIEKDEINHNFNNIENIMEGIEGNMHFIPVVKGSSESYIRKNEWFIDWGKEAIIHYKTNKKARFQNSQYYFKKGIALPMVKSSKIRANLIDNQVFDQSIVGVFPKDEKYLNFLLAFFNSEVFNSIINTINPTANNSANYVKKIPIILPKELSHIDELVNQLTDLKKINGKVNNEIQIKLDRIFTELYSDWII
ncbi:restriction endonuclease [Paenibacillus sp. PCH8]|nr:restriction endonuclease [Paenibacillus sp. PCH8]